MENALAEAKLRQEWRTPDDFWDVVNAEFDFQLDAAASPENARCTKFYTATQDSLSGECPWIKDDILRVWINPGFNNIGPWCEKAYREVEGKGSDAVVAILSLISPSTSWWMRWAGAASEIRLIGGKRIQFEPASSRVKKSSNSRENCLIIYRGDNEAPRCRVVRPKMYSWDWPEID